jgi:branched-chain amino acid transport system substrate-binding protein
MERTIRKLIVAGATAVFGASTVSAQISDDVVRIGVPADMSGIYSDLSGKGAVTPRLRESANATV